MQGHIHKRVHSMADGRTKTTWYVVLELGRDETGRRRQKWHGGYRTRREAEAARAMLVNEINIGVYAEPTKITLDEWTRGSWLPTMKSQVKPTTWARYDRMLRLHVLPVLGERPLHKLTSTLLNSLYADLIESGYRKESRGGGLHPKTVRHIHSTLHKVLGDAIDAGLLTVNPADRAKPPRPRASSPTEMKFWDAGQLGQFQARTIDLDSATVEQLRVHHQRQTPEKDAWGPGYQNSDLVFRREDGSPVHPQLFSQAFEREVRDSGLPRIRLHDLRHTHATIALRAGVPVKVISERLGHEDPAFTMKQYAHVIPGMQAEAASLVAALVFPSSKPS